MNKVIVLCDASNCDDFTLPDYEVIVLRPSGQENDIENTARFIQVSKDISCSSSILWKFLSPYVFKFVIFLLRYFPDSFLDSMTAHTVLYPVTNSALGRYYISTLRNMYGCEAHTLSAYQFIHSFLPAQDRPYYAAPCNPTSVTLFSSIKSIEYTALEVEVCVTLPSGEDASFSGSSLIVATSPLTWKDLSFQPPLPAPLLTAFRNIISGDYYSVTISYSKSHWRSGTAKPLHLISDCSRGPVSCWREVTCNEDIFSLRATAGGIPAQLLSQMPLKQRRELVLQQLAHEFGDACLQPDAYIEDVLATSDTAEEGWHAVSDATSCQHSGFPTGIISIVRDAPLPDSIHFAHADIGCNDVMSTLLRVATSKKKEPSFNMKRLLLMMSFGCGVVVVFSSLLYIAMLLFPAAFGSNSISVLQDSCSTNSMS